MRVAKRSQAEIDEIKVEIRRWYNRGLLKDTFAEIMSSAQRNQSDSISDAVQYAADNVEERYQLSRDEFMALMADAIQGSVRE